MHWRISAVSQRFHNWISNLEKPCDMKESNICQQSSVTEKKMRLSENSNMDILYSPKMAARQSIDRLETTVKSFITAGSSPQETRNLSEMLESAFKRDETLKIENCDFVSPKELRGSNGSAPQSFYDYI